MHQLLHDLRVRRPVRRERRRTARNHADAIQYGPTTITTAGTVIDDKEITSQLNINANNVTIENSDVDYSNSGNAAINVGARTTRASCWSTVRFTVKAPPTRCHSPSPSTGSDGTAITIEAVYVYNVDRIITTAGIVEDSVCLGNGNLDSVGEHYECTYVGKGSTDYVLHTVLISSPDEVGRRVLCSGRLRRAKQHRGRE